jgi:hypothetical protein
MQRILFHLLPLQQPPPPLVISRLPTTDRDNLKSRNTSQLNAFHRGPNYLLSETDAITVGSSPSVSVVHSYSNPLNPYVSSAEQPAAGKIPNSIGVQENRVRQDTAHSTSCETAANLILTMRGYPDIRDVRSELGCHSDSDCTVRNMDIFEILDK